MTILTLRPPHMVWKLRPVEHRTFAFENLVETAHLSGGDVELRVEFASDQHPSGRSPDVTSLGQLPVVSERGLSVLADLLDGVGIVPLQCEESARFALVVPVVGGALVGDVARRIRSLRKCSIPTWSRRSRSFASKSRRPRC